MLFETAIGLVLDGVPSPGPEELDIAISQAFAEGAYEEMDRIEGRLEAPDVKRVELEAGRCYRFVLRISPDAEWSPRAWSGVQIRLNELERLRSTNRGPGLVTDRTCAVEDRSPRLRVLPVLGEQDSSTWQELGRGGYTIEVWSYRMNASEEREAEAEDRAAQARYERGVAEREARDRERERQRVMQRAAPGCLRCRLAWNECAAASRTTFTCDGQYRSCLMREVPFDRDACPPPY
jgi:hypothetical protein